MREKPERFQGQWITGQPYVVERGRTWQSNPASQTLFSTHNQHPPSVNSLGPNHVLYSWGLHADVSAFEAQNNHLQTLQFDFNSILQNFFFCQIEIEQAFNVELTVVHCKPVPVVHLELGRGLLITDNEQTMSKCWCVHPVAVSRTQNQQRTPAK